MPFQVNIPTEMLPLEFWSIKGRIYLRDNASLNAVVQHIVLNERF